MSMEWWWGQIGYLTKRTKTVNEAFDSDFSRLAASKKDKSRHNHVLPRPWMPRRFRKKWKQSPKFIKKTIWKESFQIYIWIQSLFSFTLNLSPCRHQYCLRRPCGHQPTNVSHVGIGFHWELCSFFNRSSSSPDIFCQISPWRELWSCRLKLEQSSQWRLCWILLRKSFEMS